MIYRIEIWLSLANDRILTGEAVREIGDDGKGRGVFHYSPDYFRRPETFSLDPVSYKTLDL